MNIVRGDKVKVICGKDKDKTGKVLVALPQDNKAIVENINMLTKHKKPKSAQEKGGIEKNASPINVSNLMVICPVCGKATRVAHKEINGVKSRICKKCGASLDGVKEKKTKEKKTDVKVKESEVVETEGKVIKNVTKVAKGDALPAEKAKLPKKEVKTPVKKSASAVKTTKTRGISKESSNGK
ncbi:MAG: 50S ribosomal protein L24 [Bacilli bacterium]